MGGRAVDHDVLDGLLAHVGGAEHLAEQVGDQVDEHAAPAQGLGEGVVLVLGPVDPGQPVEEQPVVVAGGEPPQLGAGPVEDHLPQGAHLAVDEAGREGGRGVHGRIEPPGARPVRPAG